MIGSNIDVPVPMKIDAQAHRIAASSSLQLLLKSPMARYRAKVEQYHYKDVCSQAESSSVSNPQSITPPMRIDHSEGFKPNSLPSLFTYVSIAKTRCRTATTT